MPHPELMAAWRTARKAKAGAARTIPVCLECGVLVRYGVYVCEHGVTPARAESIRQETADLERRLA